ncbi:glutaredoxin 3 [Rhodoblastus acidophilus]|uniref:Glutaredoxin n=1 Tax=Rhodoblastus acidophilus TaxID=1074 RepID=A0A6N8DNB2_RHOAC|nr:glutaredoxin 3 [Rhodoblastus acidophilus]MCW2275651.1 glutaredoxin 3 [Rhodoblastus acidophilus]MTV31818.1 glutaredoxin 3 [Rhodoblastus acidophilus]
MPKVEIYTTATCPYCMRAKMLLAEKNVSFTEISVDGDPVLRGTMTQRAQGRTTVPQIFIGDRHVGGCDDLYALESDGALDSLLAG